MKGSYALIIELAEEQAIAVGSFKILHFPGGYYAYVGSALGGVKSRLNHHLKQNKKLHWHIDYLLQRASISSIIICDSEDRIECNIAQTLGQQFDSIPGFGSSDCKCPSHLFFATERMEQKIMMMLNSLGMKPRLVKESEPGNGIYTGV